MLLKTLIITFALFATVFGDHNEVNGVIVNKQESSYGSIGKVWVSQKGNSLHVAGRATVHKTLTRYHVDIEFVVKDSVVAREIAHIWEGDNRSSNRSFSSVGNFSVDFIGVGFKGEIRLSVHRCSNDVVCRDSKLCK